MAAGFRLLPEAELIMARRWSVIRGGPAPWISRARVRLDSGVLDSPTMVHNFLRSGERSILGGYGWRWCRRSPRRATAWSVLNWDRIVVREFVIVSTMLGRKDGGMDSMDFISVVESICADSEKSESESIYATVIRAHIGVDIDNSSLIRTICSLLELVEYFFLIMLRVMPANPVIINSNKSKVRQGRFACISYASFNLVVILMLVRLWIHH